MNNSKMLLPEEYHEELLSYFGEKKISLTDLIEAIINLYGDKSEDLCEGQPCMKTEVNDHILNIILTEEMRDMAYTINSHEQFSSKFTFHYDTLKKEGIICLK
jgi:hypothetical protein